LDSKGMAACPIRRIHYHNPSGNRVNDVIGKDGHPAMHMDHPVEVMKDEESREEESRAPERRRNPGIEIIVIPGRWIVSNYRWAFIIVIIVDDGGLDIFRACGRLIFRVLVRGIGHDGQSKFY